MKSTASLLFPLVLVLLALCQLGAVLAQRDAYEIDDGPGIIPPRVAAGRATDEVYDAMPISPADASEVAGSGAEAYDEGQEDEGGYEGRDDAEEDDDQEDEEDDDQEGEEDDEEEEEKDDDPQPRPRPVVDGEMPRNMTEEELNRIKKTNTKIDDTLFLEHIRTRNSTNSNETWSLNTATNTIVLNPPPAFHVDKPLNQTQLACMPPLASCNTPGKIADFENFRPYAVAAHNVKKPEQCAMICNHERHRDWCKSFAHTRRDRRCVFYNFTIGVGVEEKPQTGTRFWDRECWSCGVSAPPPW